MNRSQEIGIPAPALITSPDVSSAWDETNQLLVVVRARELASAKLRSRNALTIDSLFRQYALDPFGAEFSQYQRILHPVRMALHESRLHEDDDLMFVSHDAFLDAKRFLETPESGLPTLAEFLLERDINRLFSDAPEEVFENIGSWALEAVRDFNPDQSPDPAERIDFSLSGWGLTFQAYVLSTMLWKSHPWIEQAVRQIPPLQSQFDAMRRITGSCYGYCE